MDLVDLIHGRSLDIFEVDRYYITVAALKILSEEGKIPVKLVSQAIKTLGIDPEKPEPITQ